MAISDWVERNIDSTIKYTGNGKEMRVNCPVCGEVRHRLFINVENGRVYCQNCGFGKHTSIVGLIQYVEGVSYSKAFSVFKDVKGSLSLPESVSKDTINNIFMGDLRQSLDKRAIPLPEEYVPLDPKHTNIVTKRAVKYLHSRGITDRQITKYKFGFCMDGEYKHRVIIPITENGDLRFWVARAISSDAYMKEKSPSDNDWNISKSEVVFNIDVAAKKYHTAIISEGIFDAMSWGDAGISLLGKSLYQEQLNILLDYRELLTEGIYVALDYDAKDNASQIAKELSEYFKVYIINIPKQLDDPNNCLRVKGQKYLWKLMGEAEEYSEFSVLRRILT